MNHLLSNGCHGYSSRYLDRFLMMFLFEVFAEWEDLYREPSRRSLSPDHCLHYHPHSAHRRCRILRTECLSEMFERQVYYHVEIDQTLLLFDY
jgi:hypothetical protein